MRHPALISLSRDHHQVLTLSMKCRKRALGQAKPAPGESLPDFAAEVNHCIKGLLEGHFKAEEAVLFPLLAAVSAESHALTEELRGEHERIRQGLGRGEQGMGLSKALFDLADLLERHVRREERELFPIFERCIPGAEAERAGKEIEEFLRTAG